MAKTNANGEREHRISGQTVADVYGPEEQSMYAAPSEGKTCVEAGYGILG